MGLIMTIQSSNEYERAMKISVISPSDKSTVAPFYNSGWFCTLILEGKAKYRLEAIKNKDVIYFPSIFSNLRLRSPDLERKYGGSLKEMMEQQRGSQCLRRKEQGAVMLFWLLIQ